MRNGVAELLVVVGAALVATAGFVVNIPLGCAISGAMCVTIGVGIIRTQRKEPR